MHQEKLNKMGAKYSFFGRIFLCVQVENEGRYGRSRHERVIKEFSKVLTNNHAPVSHY